MVVMCKESFGSHGARRAHPGAELIEELGQNLGLPALIMRGGSQPGGMQL